jgi:hypothetical protein
MTLTLVLPSSFGHFHFIHCAIENGDGRLDAFWPFK